ncbi:hypothetical protein EV182_006945, partial [Spiromyces aspiralis]
MDFFQALSAGAEFNKKRFRDDVAIFKPVDSKEGVERIKTVDALPSELNFFGPKKTGAHSKKMKLENGGKGLGSSTMA